MTETRAVYQATDPEQLLPDQVRMLRFVFQVLTLHQLVKLAARVRQLCMVPGFGRVVIIVEKHHPARVEAGPSEALLPTLDDEAIEKLMEVKDDDESRIGS